MFRRSGSFVAFFVDGKMPDPRSEAFTEALAGQRFRSIESAASEEVSIGWVTSGDPTGDSFELEDIDLDRGLWLQVRTDKKKLPAVWVRIRKAQAERSAGRKLSARERKELKEALMDELLPKILPSVGLTDVLLEPKTGMILLFGTSTALKDEFQKLWFRTFASNLVECEPHSLAARSGLGREAIAYLDEVAPMRWSDDGSAPTPMPRKLVVAEEDPVDDEPQEVEAEEQPESEFVSGTVTFAERAAADQSPADAEATSDAPGEDADSDEAALEAEAELDPVDADTHVTADATDSASEPDAAEEHEPERHESHGYQAPTPTPDEDDEFGAGAEAEAMA